MVLNGYQIRRADSSNWVIEKEVKLKDTDPYWRVIGYFPRLEQAALYLFDLATEDRDDLKELIDHIVSAKENIINSLR